MSDGSVHPGYRASSSRSWSYAAGVSCAVVAVALVALGVVRPTEMTRGFLAGVTVVLAVELVVFRRTIERAHREGGPQRITLATWITILRGAALALLAGFLTVDGLSGDLVWVPGVLFAVAASLDAVDGAVARVTDSVTELGGRLDVELDGLTVLVGATAIVVQGSAPVAFLAVGFARYLFVFGIWSRRRRGLAVSGLPPSQLRRFLGATAMVAIWLALLPVPGQRLSWLLTAFVMVPFLLHFGRDWLAVSRGGR